MGLLISKQYIDFNEPNANRIDNIKKLASSTSKVEEELKKVPVKAMTQRDLELEDTIKRTSPWY